MSRKIVPSRLLFASAVVLGVGLAASAFAQLQFTGVSATPEQAIQINWASVSNETYKIDEADTLTTNAQGTITWNQLCTGYPSQGTNTFWLDTGNYNVVPAIVHPKLSPARFYRVVDLGPDSTSDEPVVSITGIPNGSVVSGNFAVTVAASTDQADIYTSLYVDGQEMPTTLSVTNAYENGTNYTTATYVINTCEWWNGQHTLFATARCTSTPQGPGQTGPMLVGHAVSPFVQVTFSNLITEIAFSQPFFDPSLGQTQAITAIFAANVNWTLQIQDINSNTVVTESGSGGSMVFSWDGTANGTNLPAGVYTCLFAAQTNGSPIGHLEGGGGSNTNGPLSPGMVLSSSIAVTQQTQLWAAPSDGSGIAVPLLLYPPGYDTNGLSIFEAPVAWNPMLSASDTSLLAQSGNLAPRYSNDDGGGASPAYGGNSSQSSRGPVRPPTAPIRGTVGTFGVGYQTYSANGTNGINCNPIGIGGGYGGYIQILDNPANLYLNYPQLPGFANEANNFISAMRKGAWSSSFVLKDDQITINGLSGIGTQYNTVNLGVLMLHGAYGTSQDFTAGGCKQMYFPITSGTTANYIRMSQMNFGGTTGTNGLMWMMIAACYSLYHGDWNSMQSQHIYPYNSGLHMLLGGDTFIYTEDNILADWANYMLGDPASYPPTAPETVQQAWYDAGIKDYIGKEFVSPIDLATAGDANCQNDTLQLYIPAGRHAVLQPRRSLLNE